MADYTPQVERARASIARKGRPVTLTKLPEGVGDRDDPLAGPSAKPAVLDGVPAVFVPPSSASQLGYGIRDINLFKNCSQIAIVASHPEYDLSTFSILTDFDDTDWKIEHVEVLRPAEQIILYFVGVNRP